MPVKVLLNPQENVVKATFVMEAIPQQLQSIKDVLQVQNAQLDLHHQQLVPKTNISLWLEMVHVKTVQLDTNVLPLQLLLIVNLTSIVPMV